MIGFCSEIHSKSQLTTSQINWLEQLPLQSTIDLTNLLAVYENQW
jgi:hypothetical protein